jgi:DNA-binding transcriptional regulator PaaX
VITDSYLFDSKNRNLGLFDKAIQKFDLTLINEMCKDFLEKFSEKVEEEDSNIFQDEVFIYDTVVVNLGHFSLLMLKLE